MSADGKKPVGILFTKTPFHDYKVSESLRMAVGLTLGKNSVRVFFTGDGTYCLTKNTPEKLGMLPLGKHIETLGMLKCRIVVEEEALSERNISPENLAFQNIESVTSEEFNEELSDCEVLFNS